MIAKIYKIILICFIVLYPNNSYAKKTESQYFNEKNIYNYFSAVVSLNNNKNKESLKFFNSSRPIKEYHPSYMENYLFSLVVNKKIKKAINEITMVKNKNFTDFFEAELLLLSNSLKNKDYKNSILYLNNLKDYENEGTFEFIISSILEDFVYMFNYNKIKNSQNNNLGNLSLISKAFQSCYLGKKNTDIIFQNIINSPEGGYSRYLFFYINYLLSQNHYKKAEIETRNINNLNSTLLLSQTKEWVEGKNFKEFNNIFSCKNSNDIIGEFFFLISNLYSSQGEFKKSNFYFNLSNYFNPKFKFNFSLLAENYFEIGDFKKSKETLEEFDEKNNFYYWFKIKKKAEIINKENSSEDSFEYIKAEFDKIKNPSLKTIYEMANIVKNFKKYKLSIKYYSKVLSKLDNNSLIYAQILYRRGGSYERIGDAEKSDADLIESLKINPNEPHVLNYLAYSWLERNYKIDLAIKMLEDAYFQSQDDPYIIDSIGWAYYLTGDYIRAEKLLRKAVKIMPDDPIVNDHYADILWKLGKSIQANYFWKNVLTFEDTEQEMKEDIKYKLLFGPKKI